MEFGLRSGYLQLRIFFGIVLGNDPFHARQDDVGHDLLRHATVHRFSGIERSILKELVRRRSAPAEMKVFAARLAFLHALHDQLRDFLELHRFLQSLQPRIQKVAEDEIAVHRVLHAEKLGTEAAEVPVNINVDDAQRIIFHRQRFRKIRDGSHDGDMGVANFAYEVGFADLKGKLVNTFHEIPEFLFRHGRQA